MGNHWVTWFLLLYLPSHGQCYYHRPNLASNKTVYQSMSLNYFGYNWTADFAIDGQTNFTGDGCRCCAGAGYEIPDRGPWWEINLGSEVNVGKVKVYGRHDGAFEQLYRFKMYISANTSYNQTTAPYQYVYVNNVTKYEYRNTLKGITDVVFGETPLRYVALALHEPRYNKKKVLMVVCEVEVYEACPDYRFEPDCDECHCQGDHCNKTTGLCPSGNCVAGWKGPKCDQECDDGTFGDNCSKTCHCHKGGVCNKTSGQCPAGGCDNGYHGDACDTECSNNTFGKDCSETCGHCLNNAQCDTKSGHCQSCGRGYKEKLCKLPCDAGFYGLNCSETCGNCHGNESCNHVTGHCTRCDIGYQTPLCKQKCIDRKYGIDCGSKCGHCLNTSACDVFNGTCDAGCAPGYQGNKCVDACGDRTFGPNCSFTCGNCLNNDPCDVVRGHCKEQCTAGYKGWYCNETCGFGQHGVSCNRKCGRCVGNSTCNGTSGECDGGCIQGYIAPTCTTRKEKQTGPDTVSTSVFALALTLLFLLIAVVAAVFVYRNRSHLRRILKKDSTTATTRTQFDSDYAHAVVATQSAAATGQATQVPAPRPLQKKVSILESESIPIHQMWDYIQAKKQNFSELFYKEFDTLKGGLIHPYEVGSLPDNKTKHKYRDMYAYDYNRVPLESFGDNEGDYINASFIDGYGSPKKFIASQGPIKSMIDDFWRMIWQQGTEIVVMLTNLVEVGKTKCIQYWPDGNVAQFGSISVKLMSTETYLDFDVRHLEVSRNEESCRDVTQFHFKSWPDKNVPDSAWCLVNFWRAVDMSATETPIVVHCSAGVGRTGTYIALDNAYYQGALTGSVSPLQIVRELRNQRINMVQTKDQYVYLHEAVAETFLFGTHYIWSNQYEEYHNYMTQLDPGHGNMRLETQFDLIEKSLELEGSDDMMYANLGTSGGDKGKVRLEPTCLQNYCGKETFVISALPKRTPPSELWTLILNYNVCAVITIPGAKSLPIGTNICGQFGTFEVTMKEKHLDEFMTERSFSIMQDQTSSTLTFYEGSFYRSLGTNRPEVKQVLDFLNKILAKLTPSEDRPLLIVCSDGSTHSGMVCALLSELQRIHHDDGHVNFVDTVKSMKARRRAIVPSFDQYLLCHEILLCSFSHVTEPENVYANT